MAGALRSPGGKARRGVVLALTRSLRTPVAGSDRGSRSSRIFDPGGGSSLRKGPDSLARYASRVCCVWRGHVRFHTSAFLYCGRCVVPILPGSRCHVPRCQMLGTSSASGRSFRGSWIARPAGVLVGHSSRSLSFPWCGLLLRVVGSDRPGRRSGRRAHPTGPRVARRALVAYYAKLGSGWRGRWRYPAENWVRSQTAFLAESSSRSLRYCPLGCRIAHDSGVQWAR